jgi:hypothetical protein
MDEPVAHTIDHEPALSRSPPDGKARGQPASAPLLSAPVRAHSSQSGLERFMLALWRALAVWES